MDKIFKKKIKKENIFEIKNKTKIVFENKKKENNAKKKNINDPVGVLPYALFFCFCWFFFSFFFFNPEKWAQNGKGIQLEIKQKVMGWSKHNSICGA